VIILFCSIWVFTCKKQPNQNFIKYKNKTETGSNQTISVWFNYFILKTKTQTNQFWFGLILVRFGYFILKTKNYIVIWEFFGLYNGFGFGSV
jgi:hypothetical protein